MRRIYNILKVCLVLMNPLVIFGQTTNEGMFYISEGTVFSTLQDLDNTASGSFINDGDSFIYRSFNNDGIVDYYGATGLTRFIGNTPQLISGIQESFLYNIYFDNSSSQSPFHLLGMLNASGLVNFYQGIVDNDTFGGRFVFSQDAIHTNTSDFGHVDGPVLKEGTTEFIYPIGDGGYYRFAGISAPTQLTDSFEGKYYLENSDTLYPHSSRENSIELIDNNEYWTIEKTTGDSEVLITLSWRDVTTPSEIIAEPQVGNIHIVRWDETQQLWVDEGGVVDVDNQTVTTVVSGYGVYTLARVNDATVLPCGLEIFNAVSADDNGENDYFLIEGLENDSCASNVKVKIFNRWGVEVFESNNYGRMGDVFRGYSDGRMTLNRNEKLPTGTYFYILTFNYPGLNDATKLYKTTGYLYLTTN